MLHWQQNKAKVRSIATICGATLLVHGVVLGLLFFASGRGSLTLLVTAQMPCKGQRIVVLPFHKKKIHNAGNASSAVGTRAQKQLVPPAKQTSITKKSQHVKKQAQPPVKKKSESKQRDKKPTVQKKVKSEKQRKQLPDKKVTPPQPVEQVEKPEQAARESSVQTAVDAAADIVYMDAQEHELFVLCEQIQKEVARCWKPPKGVDSTTSCTVIVSVDWQGVMTQYTVVEASSVLMFDISVRSSLKDMVFPRASYGKDITITFVQEKKP